MTAFLELTSILIAWGCFFVALRSLGLPSWIFALTFWLSGWAGTSLEVGKVITGSQLDFFGGDVVIASVAYSVAWSSRRLTTALRNMALQVADEIAAGEVDEQTGCHLVARSVYVRVPPPYVPRWRWAVGMRSSAGSLHAFTGVCWLRNVNKNPGALPLPDDLYRTRRKLGRWREVH